METKLTSSPAPTRLSLGANRVSPCTHSTKPSTATQNSPQRLSMAVASRKEPPWRPQPGGLGDPASRTPPHPRCVDFLSPSLEGTEAMFQAESMNPTAVSRPEANGPRAQTPNPGARETSKGSHAEDTPGASLPPSVRAGNRHRQAWEVQLHQRPPPRALGGRSLHTAGWIPGFLLPGRGRGRGGGAHHRSSRIRSTNTVHAHGF